MSYRRRKRSFQHEEAHADKDVDFKPPISHPEVPSSPPRMVVTAEELDEVVHEIRDAGLVAYDTEFIGEETYHPRICLIQLATTDLVAIVDPFVLDDLTPIWEALADPEVETIVHAGHVDLMHVRREIGVEPQCVIDTQVAAAFAGLPWPVGLARVIESYTGQRLGKGHTFTNWDARPLSAQQLRYAVDDVRYLPMLWTMLKGDLEQRGTLDWVRNECTSRMSGGLEFDPDPQTRRASKGMHLKPRAQALLRALVLERDRIAHAEDRPHRVVLPDSSLLELVRKRPSKRADLIGIRGLPRPTGERWHQDLIDLIARADELPLPERKITGSSAESASDQVAIDALWTVICTRLLALGIAPGMVITRSALANWYLLAYLPDRTPLFEPSDWRFEALGEWLGAFLDGKRRLSVSWGDRGAVVDEQGTVHDGSGLHGNGSQPSDEPS
ncbi:MAG: HRDC domain-containing protein [Phycisphaerales bacterium]|nr:HRDC domain-containing protein [Phycisphaerales bacterium]